MRAWPWEGQMLIMTITLIPFILHCRGHCRFTPLRFGCPLRLSTLQCSSISQLIRYCGGTETVLLQLCWRAGRRPQGISLSTHGPPVAFLPPLACALARRRESTPAVAHLSPMAQTAARSSCAEYCGDVSAAPRSALSRRQRRTAVLRTWHMWRHQAFGIRHRAAAGASEGE